ncbi:unnamed protein product [Merluccius merluccius]
MAAVAVLRNETLHAFLQDRTPNSSPETCKHSPLALLAATCNRIGGHHHHHHHHPHHPHPHGSSPADFLQTQLSAHIQTSFSSHHPHPHPTHPHPHELPLTPPADPSYPYDFSPVKMLPCSMQSLPSSCPPPTYVPAVTYAAAAAVAAPAAPPGFGALTGTSGTLMHHHHPHQQPSPTNPGDADIPWWSLQQGGAHHHHHHHHHRFQLQRGLAVLGHADFAQYQTQIAALLHTKSPLASSARRCRRCRCPNCQSTSSSTSTSSDEPGKKKQHICHIPGCGKVYGKTSDELQRHLRTHTGEKRFVCAVTAASGSCARDHLAKHVKTHQNKKSKCHEKGGLEHRVKREDPRSML